MKKFCYLITGFALLMASCSSEEPANDNTDFQEVPGNGFVSFKLRASQVSPATRATAPGTYLDGTANENNVSQVRFYFFDDQGGAFAVKKNGATGDYNNFIDWYPNSSDFGPAEPEETVEKVINATLSINLEDPNEYPAKVVAVINPNSVILGLDNGTTNAENLNGPTLGDLRDVVSDFASNITPTSGNFVMSNSVYVETSENKKETMYATDIDATKIKQSLEAAVSDPVTIYVERVVARVDFQISPNMAQEGNFKVLDNDEIIYKVATVQRNTVNDKGQTSYDNMNVYVRFLGWNATGTTNQSRLIKDINKGWDPDAILGEGNIWNTSDYHRSFWAINPETVSYEYGNLLKDGQYIGSEGSTNANPANAFPIPAAGTWSNPLYIQENAAPFDNNTNAPFYPTKIIMAAQLCDENGNSIEIAEWGNKIYTIDGVKNMLCNVLHDLRKKVGSEYKSIEPGDIKFVYDDPTQTAKEENYYVYVTLTDNALQNEWALYDGTKYTELKDKEVLTYIRDNTNHVKVWTTGYAYYWFDIRHLGSAKNVPGYVGIVRNHVYRITVNSVAGLGCPVFDPRQEIIPEENQPDASLISAEVKILQWRVVSQGYDVTW